MNEPCEEMYKKFFKDFIDFKNEAELHKKRGNNDFNPLLCVQKVDNEENMHSGMLYGLLNVRGEHYQDELFLDLFLEQVGLKGWFGNTKSAYVKTEYKNMDIYISNGEKHIILENKIWAGDGIGQIARYIDSVHKNTNEDSNEGAISYNNIAVIYLTPFSDREPDSNSLKDWKIDNGFLVSGENKVVFKNISYSDEILKWINKCKEKVGCIFSLNAGLEFYKDVVKIITNKKENKMNIKEFLNKQPEFIEQAFEMLREQDKIFEAFCEYVKEKCDLNSKEKFEENNYVYSINMEKYPCFWLSIIKNKHKIYVSFYLDDDKHNKFDKTNKKEFLECLQGIDSSIVIYGGSDYDYYKDTNYLTLDKYKVFDIYKDDIKEIIDYINSTKVAITSINQKIKADLDKGADSKLARFGFTIYDEE